MNQVREGMLRERQHNLPAPLSPLVGREQELDVLGDLLQQDGVRLVTLTGPGGTGKTRLAIEVARRLLDRFPHGVFFISLAPLQEPELVPATIAKVLGVPEQGAEAVLETLKSQLARRKLLLVLDNFEHLMDATLVVAELLAALPDAKVLVTSREWLRLRGERHFPVHPLATPASGKPRQRLPLVEAAQSPAVELFRQRASASRPSFRLTEDNIASVAEICARLDGLPLAIELAAARLPLFGTPQALLGRLESGLKLLTSGARDLPARQKTLRETMQWSYDLLAPSEQKLFRRLAVFIGGRTVEAVEAVCQGDGEMDGDVLDGLEALLDKSLLQREESKDGEPRFVMLQTIHEFARVCLESSGEADAIRLRHAHFFLSLAEKARPELTGPRQGHWLERLEQERNNVRAALDWLQRTNQTTLMMKLLDALYWFWYVRGPLSEGRRWLEYVLSSTKSEHHSPLWGQILKAAAGLAWAQGDYQAAREYFAATLEIAEQSGDQARLSTALNGLGIVAARQGNFEEAQSYLERSLDLAERMEPISHGVGIRLANVAMNLANQGKYEAALPYLERSLAIAEEIGDKNMTAMALGDIGFIVAQLGDLATARANLERCLELAEELGEKLRLAHALDKLGIIHAMQGDYATARTYYGQSMAVAEAAGSKWQLAETLSDLAALEAETNNASYAAKLWGGVERLRNEIGAALVPGDRERYEPSLAKARKQLGNETFDTGVAEGHAMRLEETIALACKRAAESTIPLPQGRPDLPAGLTPREIEVLQLVAQGLTDAQVAEVLFISPRTVNAHLTSIYSKLNVNSRTAASLLAVENGWLNG